MTLSATVSDGELQSTVLQPRSVLGVLAFSLGQSLR